MTTYRTAYKYPTSSITYSKEDFTRTFTLYLREQVVLFTKINEYDIYNKCKTARPLYLQIIRYFKQFNIGSSPCVNRFIKNYVQKAYESIKEVEECYIPFPERSKKEVKYLKMYLTTLNNFLNLISNRTAVVKDVLKTKTPLPYDLFPLICDYIGA
jgi:hypothetical protein